MRPSPWFEPPAGATDAGGASHSRLGLAERHRDEVRRVARLDAHEDRALAFFLRVLESAAHVRRIGNLLAADLENDVAGFESLVGSESVGIDLGDDDALRAAAGDLTRGHDGEAEPRHVGTLRAGGVRHVRARLALAGQFAERDRERLFLALAPHR